ncbi:hypothetical protein [Methylobacterium organophilum]|uniref:Uncharacterized protein n=1 Tax=Methylobacterium organophilum TaxID=410 RepID=A0ABQ4THK0_METOR|nr:hypothetical protein [Methylobacterium organophilum]GJE29807.1 hypothetical protein LKMONMHP_4693 [Methylobacterium organophilum]
MSAIPLAPYAPDVASVDAAVSAIAQNVVPRADGYAPIPAPVPITSALPDPCRGAIAVVSPAFGTTRYYAGTARGLFRYDGLGGWADASNPGRTYSIPTDDSWSFALYGSRLVATSANTPPQVIDIDAGKIFADLGGGPPRARLVSIVGEFLILGGLASDPNSVQWSDLGDPESWPLGVQNGHEGDLQILPDGGAVTGFAGGESGLVFQERAIRRMTFSGGSTIFDFSVLEENRGAVSPSAVAKAGGRVFFLDRDGFYAFPYAGSASVPIGAERVNRTFLDRVDPNHIGATVAVRDATGPRILFAYRTRSAPTGDPTLRDEGLVYDWLLDRWAGPITIQLRAGLTAATPAVSIDALPGSIDDPSQPSLDDPIYAGGVPALGFVTADNRLSLLTGAPLEAVFATAEAMLARPNRAFVTGVRLDSDADDWRVQVGGREGLGQSAAVAYRPETAPTVERIAPCRSSARYHRARIRIPAGTAWSYASGIEVEAVAEGLR